MNDSRPPPTLTFPPGVGPQKRLRALALLTAVLFLGWTVWSTGVLPRLDPVHGVGHVARSVGVRLLLWVVPSAIYLYWVHQRRALECLRLNLPPSGAHWLTGVGIVGLASFAVSLDVGRKLGEPVSQVWLELLHSYSFEFPTAPLFEELIFRGVILSELLIVMRAHRLEHPNDVPGRLRGWLANVTASLVFLGLHWPWWIYTRGMDSVFWTNSAGVFLISLVLGMVFIRTKSLWPCIALHWINNALNGLVPMS